MYTIQTEIFSQPPFLMLINPNETNYQMQMIKDIKSRGSYVITLGHHTKDYWKSDYHVSLNTIEAPIAWGIPFINICQLLAFYKAIETGHNPDIPGGLNPYISLASNISPQATGH